MVRHNWVELQECIPHGIDVHLRLDDANAHFAQLLVHARNLFQEPAMISSFNNTKLRNFSLRTFSEVKWDRVSKTKTNLIELQSLSSISNFVHVVVLITERSAFSDSSS